MILDTLERGERYRCLLPGLAAGFEFLLRPDLAQLPPGRHEIDGTRVYASIAAETGRDTSGARLEVHRRYVDIQVSLDGRERIGWRPLADCREPAIPYDAERDIAFFDDRPGVWLPLERRQFMIFFPDDAHAPLAGVGPLLKVVVKIALEAG